LRLPKAFLKVLSKIALGGLLAFLAFHYIDFEQVLQSLKSVNLKVVLYVILLVFISRTMMAYKWLLLLRASSLNIPFPQLLSIYYQSAFLSWVAPTAMAGEIVRGYFVTAYAGQWNHVVSSMVVERVLGLIASSVLAAIAAVTMFDYISLDNDIPLIWYIAGFTTAGLGLFYISLSEPFQRFITKLNPIAALAPPLEKLFSSYRNYRSHSKTLSAGLAISCVEAIVQVLIVLVVALGLGTNAEPSVLFCAILVGQYLRRIVFIIDGWILGEVILIVVCRMAGIDQSEALAFSIVSTALRIIALSPGGLLLIIGRRTKRQPTSS